MVKLSLSLLILLVTSCSGSGGDEPTEFRGFEESEIDGEPRILASHLQLFASSAVDGTRMEQRSFTQSFDNGLITAHTLQATGYRMQHPRLLHDAKSGRVFMTVAAALNRPFDSGITRTDECPEGLRTIILAESTENKASEFEYSSLVAADCGYRVTNADMFLHDDRRLYIPYISVGGADQCRYDNSESRPAIPVTTGLGGKRWQVRLRVSGSIDDPPLQFSGLTDDHDYEVLQEVCVPNRVHGGSDGIGSAEPYIYRIDGDLIYLVYADEYLASEHSCGQVIRHITYSISTDTVLANDEIGQCPGDGIRDGMPVIAFDPGADTQLMIFESLGGGRSDEIVLMSYRNGSSSLERSTLLRASDIGATTVGVPYIKRYRNYVLATFVAVYGDRRKTQLRMIVLDRDGNKVDFGDSIPDVFTLMETDYRDDGEPNLLWGGTEIIDGILYAANDRVDEVRVTAVDISALPQRAHLRWDGYKDRRRCSMDIWVGGKRVACSYSSTIGDEQSFTFTGHCSRQDRNYPIAEVTEFGLHCALDGDFGDTDNVLHTRTPFDGIKAQVDLHFD